MRAERIFDFGREDILAARDDHVLEPVADEQKAIIVHMPDIARLDPAIDDCMRGEFGIVPIDEHRSEEYTSELQSLMRNSYAVFCWKKNKQHTTKPKLLTTT